MHTISDQIRQKLLKNPNVESVTIHQIHYSGSFKIAAVKSYLKGEMPNDIFISAGFDPKDFVYKYCASCIKRWKTKYEEDGIDSLKKRKKIKKIPGRPKSEKPNELSYEELLTVVEIQREVIDELKKSKALAKKRY